MPATSDPMRTDMARRSPLSERIRLIRILRTHGLRAVERLRADELKVALDKLGLTLQGDEQPPFGEDRTPPSSGELVKRGAEVPPLPAVEAPVDPMDRRFKEPDNFLPEGERTFLRLVAVDWQQLYATWDLDADAWARLGNDEAQIKIRVADASSDEHGDFLSSHHVKPGARGWYVPAPEQRLRVVAALTTSRSEVLAVSNAVIVPPNHPSPPGPLRFATVPVGIDRRRLRGGQLLNALIDDLTDLPEGVVVSESGREVRSRLPGEIEDSAPSSGRRRLITSAAPGMPAVASATPPDSAPSSGSAVSSSGSAPSSWKSAPSSGALR